LFYFVNYSFFFFPFFFFFFSFSLSVSFLEEHKAETYSPACCFIFPRHRWRIKDMGQASKKEWSMCIFSISIIVHVFAQQILG
jgi:hypothetical protein